MKRLLLFGMIFILTGCASGQALRISSTPKAEVYTVVKDDHDKQKKGEYLGSTPVFVHHKVFDEHGKMTFMVLLPDIPDVALIKEAAESTTQLPFDLKSEYFKKRNLDEFMRKVITDGDLAHGMTKEQIMISQGAPDKILKEGTNTEKWIYGYPDQYGYIETHYIIVEDGKLKDWHPKLKDS